MDLGTPFQLRKAVSADQTFQLRKAVSADQKLLSSLISAPLDGQPMLSASDGGVEDNRMGFDATASFGIVWHLF